MHRLNKKYVKTGSLGAYGKTLDIDAATGVVTDPTNDLTDKDNTFDFDEIGLNAAPVVPAAAQDGITTPVVDYRFVQEGTAKFIAGDVRIDVCEQANAKIFGTQYVLGTSVADLNTTTGLIEVDVDGDGTADILNATGGCDSNGVADDLNTTVATTAVGGVYYKKLN